MNTEEEKKPEQIKAADEDVNMDQDILHDIFHTEVNPHAHKRSHKEAGDDSIDPLSHRKREGKSDESTPPERFTGL
jgi:L-rhamnose isomerase